MRDKIIEYLEEGHSCCASSKALADAILQTFLDSLPEKRKVPSFRDIGHWETVGFNNCIDLIKQKIKGGL